MSRREGDVCATCEHWTRYKSSEKSQNHLGQCSELPNGEYAASYPETDDDFYCAWWTPRSKQDIGD